MGNADAKLQRGLTLLGQAGNDAELLGVGFLAVHGAIEDWLDNQLSLRDDLAEADRQALKAEGYTWRTRALLAQRYGLVNDDERATLIEANRARNEFAHGEPLQWRGAAVRAYARTVARLCGHADWAELLDPRRAPTQAVPRATTSARPTPPRPAPRPATSTTVIIPRQISGLSPAMFAALCLLLVLLIGAAWLLLSRQSQNTDTPGLPPGLTNNTLDATASLPQPAAALQPTASILPAPTSAPRTARISRLGGSPGALHQTPDFGAPQLALPLRDGDLVEVVGEPQLDANGTPWQQIKLGSESGWIPLNNLDF